MSNPLDMTQDDVERWNQWCAEQSVRIPGNESNGGCDTDILVWDLDFDGRVRMEVDNSKGTFHQRALARLTPTEARRLGNLLLQAADIVDGVVEQDNRNTK
jgi:hypothetical protein